MQQKQRAQSRAHLNAHDPLPLALGVGLLVRAEAVLLPEEPAVERACPGEHLVLGVGAGRVVPCARTEPSYNTVRGKKCDARLQEVWPVCRKVSDV